MLFITYRFFDFQTHQAHIEHFKNIFWKSEAKHGKILFSAKITKVNRIENLF